MEAVQNVCEKNKGLSQLHLAAERGDTEAVRRILISSANIDVLDTMHNTLLHYATLNGQIDVVNLLLSKDASVNSRNASAKTSLHLAAEIGHLAIAQLLLDSNADVHVADQVMNTPIHIAAMHGHYEIVQLLIKYSDVQLMLYGNTPLHLAAKFGHTNVAQLFLDQIQIADATNLDGDTPLHLASRNGHFDVVKVLLKNNGDANIRNASSKTPLHIAAEKVNAEIAKAMIDHEGEVNAVDRNGDTALHHAASNDQHGVNLLLNQTAVRNAQIRSQLAMNQVSEHEFELSQYPMRNTIKVHQASDQIVAQVDNFEMTDTLLSQSSTVNAVFKEQSTPLHQAVEHGRGHAEIVEHLIFNVPNVNACNNAKMTPLHLASQNGHTSIVEILLDNHAIVDVMKQSEETPFYLAAENGHADVSDLLLRRGVCDFVFRNGNETPLHIAVVSGHMKVVKVILKYMYNCRISEKLTNHGQELQENAKNLIETKDIEPIQLLRSDGRRVSAGLVWGEKSKPLEIWKRFDQSNALDIAIRFTQRKMVELLLNVDQCVYSEEHLRSAFNCLIRSIIECNIKKRQETAKVRIDEQYEMYCEKVKEIAQALIYSSKFDVSHQDQDGQTPLHRVILELFKGDTPKTIHLNYSLIQLLLEKGADFNIKDPSGKTPLMIASEKGCCHAIQILIEWEQKSGIKLDIDARDRYGETALIKAAERNRVSVMRLLLSHRASVNLHNCYGFTALHAAIYMYEPHRDWLDLHFFCKRLIELYIDGDGPLEIISSREKLTWRKKRWMHVQ